MDELKAKIKQVMIDHLTPLGWPDSEPELIMRELKPMWIKIEEAGLIQPGMSYEAFREHAMDQFLKNEIASMRILG